jgi:hypothetical protein
LSALFADLYFRTSGSVTSGLREAMMGVNSHLMTHNATAGERYLVNLSVMVLRGRELFVARVGGVVTLILSADTLTTAPDDLHDEFAVNGLPLGYSPAPDIRYARYESLPGQVLVQGDSGLAYLDSDRLKLILQGEDNAAILTGLKTIAGSFTQAMIIEFRYTDAESTPPPTPPLSSPTPAPSIMTPPVAPPSNPVINTFTSEVPAPVVTPPVESVTPVAPVEVESTTVPPVPESSEPIAPAESTPPRKGLAGAISWILRGISRLLTTLLDKLLPENAPSSPTQVPITAIIMTAILIPVIVMAVMVGLQLTMQDVTQFEQLVSQIQVQANEAASAPKTDPERIRTLWIAVLQRVEEAELQRANDPTLVKIRGQAQTALDEYGRVTRKTPIPLRTFPNNPQLNAILMQGGTDLYTLDLANGAVYRDTLRQPDQISTQRGQVPIIQSGQAASGYTVRDLIDILWVDEGGIRTSHALVGLARGGYLVTYSPAFPPANAQALPGSERWKKPVAMRVWQERLYILDPGANQIWRYVPAGTTYPNPPQVYFETEYNRNLSNAVDFAIDERGAVYVLFANGTMKKYIAGAEQSFNLNGIPEGGLRSANAMHLDSRSALPTLYVIDPIDQAVFEFTLAGTFQNRFRSADPTLFKKLSAIYSEGSRVYVTDGNVLYTFETTKPKP